MSNKRYNVITVRSSIRIAIFNIPVFEFVMLPGKEYNLPVKININGC